MLDVVAEMILVTESNIDASPLRRKEEPLSLKGGQEAFLQNYSQLGEKKQLLNRS